jgi:hypothetical protein
MNHKKLKYFILVVLLSGCIHSFGQQLSKFEYFFDTDPGLGKGTSLALNKTKIDTSYSLSVSALSNGLHTFYIRATDTSGGWSLTTTSSFVKYSGVDTILNIERIEYFFDKDPGFGNGTALSITPGNTVSNLFNIIVPDNGTDFTTFHLRTKDSYGRWSLMYDTTYNLCQLYKTVANFDYIRYGGQYSLIDSSRNNNQHKLKWIYDDGGPNDTIMNPIHLLSIGRHFVKLITGFGCRADSITKGLFTGLEGYSPQSIIGAGDYNIDVYGSGFDTTAKATLYDGATTINPVSKKIIDNSHAVFKFDLHKLINTASARYLDLDIKFPKGYDTLIKNAIQFQTPNTFGLFDSSAIRPLLSVTLDQPGITGSNTWHYGSITVQNKGYEVQGAQLNSNGGSGATLSYTGVWYPFYGNGGPIAKMVPLNLIFDNQLQSIQILGFPITNYSDNPSPNFQKRIDSFPAFSFIDTLQGKDFKGRLFQLVIPEIASGQSITINYRYLTPASLVSELKTYYWVGHPLIGSPMRDNAVNCLTNAVSTIASLAEIVPQFQIAAAITGCGSTIVQNAYSYFTGGVSGGMSWASLLGNVVWNCVQAYPPAAKIIQASQYAGLVNAGSNLSTGSSYLQSLSQCISLFLPINIFSTYNFASADPNQLIGPMGFDTAKHYINLNNNVPYQIEFENKRIATRSAQTVTIKDTISSKLNLSTLQITHFSLGDSIFKVPPFRNQYTTTIDFRTKQKVYVRFNAKIDSVSRSLTCNFTSLDPVTLQVITDTTLAGFLPPDIDSLSGRGTIGFTISQDTLNKNLDIIENRASIVFDSNDPILTNTWKNVLDRNNPTSKIDSVRLISDTTFRVYYTSGDGESGIGTNYLYGSINSSKYITLASSANKFVDVIGRKDSVYELLTIPYDNVQNLTSKSLAEVKFTLYNLGPVTGDSLICIDNTKSYKVSDTTKGGTWKSSDVTIATVDSLGNVKGLKAGNAVISYTVNRNNLVGTATRNIVVKPIVTKPSITWDGSQFSTSATGVSYQWLLNNSAVSGANSATYKPIAIGTYRIQVSTDSATCKNVSDSFVLVVTAIGTFNTPAGHIAKVLPNPASNQVSIQFGQTPAVSLTVQLINVEGKIVKTITTRSQTTNIALADVSSGHYFIKIIGKEYDQTQQLLISK